MYAPELDLTSLVAGINNISQSVGVTAEKAGEALLNMTKALSYTSDCGSYAVMDSYGSLSDQLEELSKAIEKLKKEQDEVRNEIMLRDMNCLGKLHGKDVYEITSDVLVKAYMETGSVPQLYGKKSNMFYWCTVDNNHYIVDSLGEGYGYLEKIGYQYKFIAFARHATMEEMFPYSCKKYEKEPEEEIITERKTVEAITTVRATDKESGDALDKAVYESLTRTEDWLNSTVEMPTSSLLEDLLK